MKLTLSKQKKICGLPVYKKYIAEKMIRRDFIGGIYRESINYEEYGEALRQAYFLGMPIWGKRVNQRIITWHVGESRVLKQFTIADGLANVLERTFNGMRVVPIKDKKHAFIFRSNSGEIALLLMFFWKQLLERNEIKHREQVVVLCTKQYHQDMLKLYFPEIRSVVLNPKILSFVHDDLEAGEWYVHMCFPGKYFVQMESNFDSGPVNYLEWMGRWFGLSVQSPERPDAEELNNALISARGKLTKEQNDALMDKSSKGLAILALESVTSSNLDEWLKNQIRSEISKKFVVLENSNKFSYPEIYGIATKAKKLIALRSGLVDFLSNAGIELYIYYTSFRNRNVNVSYRSAKQVLDLYSIKWIPLENTRNAQEYVIDEY